MPKTVTTHFINILQLQLTNQKKLIMVDLLKDIIGRNRKGETCHPYKYQRGPMSGMYVYTLTGNDNFECTDEANLRLLIESGTFNRGGRIRMLPKTAVSTASASAINVISYRGKSIA